jgi:TetR/AcrR family transcriptional regulator, transcriptional repressor of bet genes
MSRKSNTEQRRQEIVSALLAAMAEHGYEKATIQTIAQKAGLTPGLIHYHFKSKEEILLHLVKSLAELSRARYKEFVTSATTPEEKLKAYIDARLSQGTSANPDAVAAWVVIGAEAVRQPQVRAIYQEAMAAELALLTELLKACLADQGKKTKNVPHLAAGLLAFMEGSFQLASAARDIMPKGYAATTAMQLVQRYIDAEPCR